MFKCKKDDEINFYIDILEGIDNKTIKKSLINDLKWYDKKTKSSKKYFVCLTFLTISIPALTPVINSYFDNKNLANIIAAVNTIVSSWLAFRNYKLSWVRYGQAYGEIKREIRCKLVKSDKYPNPNERQDLLEKELFYRVEKITAMENGNWSDYIMKKDSKDKTKNSENNESKKDDDFNKNKSNEEKSHDEKNDKK